MSRLGTAARATALGVSALGAAVYLTAFRPRSQVFGSFPYAAQTAEKVVALSFDDGPNEPYTSRLLDTLDTYNVKATFFQVGPLCATVSVHHPARGAERPRPG